MERLDKKTMNFAGYEHRSKIRGIYRQDDQILNKDPYDLKKVDAGKKKTTKGSGKAVLLNMDKQSNRDFKKLYSSSVGEAYANIKRENDKADYIKQLLSKA